MALTDEDYRKKAQQDIKDRSAAMAEAAEMRRIRADAARKYKEDAVSKRAYGTAVKDYQTELMLNPPDTAGYTMGKFYDSVGDKARSVGKFFGTNQMTSQDDEAQMQARKDVKGYKKGGSVKSSASKRADGIATKGKTKGRMI